MRVLTHVSLVTAALLLVLRGADPGVRPPAGLSVRVSPIHAVPAAPSVAPATLPGLPATALRPEQLTAVVRQYCVTCHNDQLLTANLSLEAFDVAKAAEHAEIAEKMIAKLRAGQMPKSPAPRPAGDTLLALVTTLETLIDNAAPKLGIAGTRSFQRLNRPEYRASIRDLLDLDVDPGAFLPLDAKSDNFDNITDAQILNPTLLDGYMRAASEISRMAIGYDPKALTPMSAQYRVPRLTSQTEHVDGAPMGTRGGLSVMHNFPADGNYYFSLTFASNTSSIFAGGSPFDEQIEISIDGERVALLNVDRHMETSDSAGVTVKTGPHFVRAGPQRLSAAFIEQWEGPVVDIFAPIGHSLADLDIGGEYGITHVNHLQDLVITGPYEPRATTEATPARARIFTCRPAAAGEGRACAERIMLDLASRAYRQVLVPKDIQGLMSFYDRGEAAGGFEEGVRMALEAVLASPRFIFRFEPVRDAAPGIPRPITDAALASRLSFFLWGAPPDAELLQLASKGRLAKTSALDDQVKRMLRDRRSNALAHRFVDQWLRLDDLDKVYPDYRQYPDFDEQLQRSMRQETQLFFDHILQEDRSVLELFTADYTFVNERLARHYGIPGVVGDAFRQVKYPDDRRGGILGHASILTLTSQASRTSPVGRGKWVLEVLVGTPPPPPPPNVNTTLAPVENAAQARLLTVRELMEQHRAAPVCASCHGMMDPIGLALENFDVTGRWRLRDNGAPVESNTTLWNGTPLEGPADLRGALLEFRESLLRTFTRNLMTYALGRRVEYYDMPTVRRIIKDAAADDYALSSFVRGVVESAAFRMRTETVTAERTSSN